ncbi:MAG: pyruvate kinase [Candidatus Andersenbacteria bacterium]|nr:pyruvate kinase [bacterium]MDZ4225480.1 pyruvate kinase [Candidatus Andersenbacteria bacterium]
MTDGGEQIINRTKIVCTIGPASSSMGVLKQMLAAGMDVARINFSHGDYDSNLVLIDRIREVAESVDQPVAIMLDLQGPKIRVGQLPLEGLDLIEGQMATLLAGVMSAPEGMIPVPYERLARDVSRGDRILLDDGNLEVEVLDKRGSEIKAKVLLGGRLLSHKGINVPTVTLSVESLTAKDDQDLSFGLKQNIDFVALSFVRSSEDVVKLREKIKKYLPDGIEPPQIIAKIEKHEALDNFDGILTQADAIMIARGDLGLETPASKVPIRQKELIAKCVVAGKPVIVATQLLHSMHESPRPTRAEVSDVANAVLDHADAVMLSGETAMGQYPVESVRAMAQVIEATNERQLDNLMPQRDSVAGTVPQAVAAAAVELARQVVAKVILVTTHSGYSARSVVMYRPNTPVFAFSDSPRTRTTLMLSWGVNPYVSDGLERPEEMVRLAMTELVKKKIVQTGDKIVVVSGLAREDHGYDSGVRVIKI